MRVSAVCMRNLVPTCPIRQCTANAIVLPQTDYRDDLNNTVEVLELHASSPILLTSSSARTLNDLKIKSLVPGELADISWHVLAAMHVLLSDIILAVEPCMLQCTA